MGVASALSVFFGVSGLGTLLALLMIGAGVGAGLGSAIILFRVDTMPNWLLLLAILLALSLVGLAGAWGGFKIGAAVTAIEEARCVGVCQYFFKPRTYMALGAIIAAVLVASAVRTGWGIREHSRRATVRSETGGSPFPSLGDRPFPSLIEASTGKNQPEPGHGADGFGEAR